MAFFDIPGIGFRLESSVAEMTTIAFVGEISWNPQMHSKLMLAWQLTFNVECVKLAAAREQGRNLVFLRRAKTDVV